MSNNNMNGIAETVDESLISPNDVLSQKGKGRREGNRILRETIEARYDEFHASTLQRKKEIVDEIVLGVQGRFLGWDKEHRRYFVLTNEDAVTITQQESNKDTNQDPNQDPNQDTNQEPSIPEAAAAVLSLEAKPPNGNEVELTSGMGSMSLDSDLRRIVAQLSVDMFEDEDTARGVLLNLLFDEGGEQLAQTLLSMMNSAGHKAPPTAARPSCSPLELGGQDQETIKAGKEALLQQQRPSKSPRHNAPEKAKEAKPGGMEDDKTKSSYGGHSVLSFQIEHDMQNIKIVEKLRMGSKKDRVYSGSMMDDKPHGMGSMIYDNGRVLIGNWAHGVFQGQGCAIYENGDKCFGSFLKGMADGYVTYMTKFSKYVGDFQENTRHGNGVYNDIQMGLYNGDFVAGRFEGLGVHTAMNGNITKGRFENWKIKNKAATSNEADVKKACSKM